VESSQRLPDAAAGVRGGAWTAARRCAGGVRSGEGRIGRAGRQRIVLGGGWRRGVTKGCDASLSAADGAVGGGGAADSRRRMDETSRDVSSEIPKVPVECL
jgi:hypothetical protein